MRRLNKRTVRLILLAVALLLIVIVIPRLRYGTQVAEFLVRIEQPGAEADQLAEDSIQRLITESAQYDVLEQENAELREQLNFLDRQQYTFTAAYVISRDLLDKNLITITAGSEHGVEVGQAVIAGDGIVIGKILRTTAQRSVVELLTSDFSRLLVQISDKPNIEGVIRGDLGARLLMELIPSSANLEPDDIVVTSGLEDRIPAGLLVGTIDSITEEPGDVFKEAIVEALRPYTKLSVISVVKYAE